MNWRSGRDWWDFTLEAAKDYLVPFGLFATLLKLEEHVIPLIFWPIVAGLIIYCGWRIWREIRLKKFRQLLSEFESLARFDSIKFDPSFEYHTAQRIVTIDPPDVEYEGAEEGNNRTHINQSEVLRKIAGDTPVEFDDLGFRAWFDVGEGEREAAVEKTQLNPREFEVRISFPGAAVLPNGKLRLRWHFRWPRAASQRKDYWLLPLASYKVGQLKAQFRFTFQPQNVQFCRLEANGDKNPIALRGPIRVNGHVISYEAEVTLPSGIYVIHWQRT